jgi:hypothetical protein
MKVAENGGFVVLRAAFLPLQPCSCAWRPFSLGRQGSGRWSARRPLSCDSRLAAATPAALAQKSSAAISMHTILGWPLSPADRVMGSGSTA